MGRWRRGARLWQPMPWWRLHALQRKGGAVFVHPPRTRTTNIQPEPIPMIKAVTFISIPTRDQDRALAFYTDQLGFRVVTDQPFGEQRWIELRIPGAETGVVLFTPPGQEDRIGGFMK